ncbi:MAG TPA: hypothetical protein VN282_27250 [Pyrinomonadaceae bacterium]|nr:hypothetical protein [Pyrinomonadaceae bacterium]
MMRTSLTLSILLASSILLRPASQRFITGGVTARAQASQAGWRVELEEGKTTRSTLSINNRCLEAHLFRIKSSVKYLQFEEPTDSVLIPAGSSKLLGVRFDATGLKSKVYESKVVVECRDCKKKGSKCTQDRDEVPVELTVVKPAPPQGAPVNVLAAPSPGKKEPEPLAVAHCYCRVAAFQGDEVAKVSSPIIDYGVIKTYTGPFPQNDNNRKDCCAECSKKAAQDSRFTNPDNLCNMINRGFSDRVVAYCAVGTKNYSICQTTFAKCCATGGDITCPQGWLADSNGPGNNKCKTLACKLSTPPFPPNNTLIGTWGFTWGDGIWKWGPATSITPVVYKSCP